LAAASGLGLAGIAGRFAIAVVVVVSQGAPGSEKQDDGKEDAERPSLEQTHRFTTP
jgi:hypothetical protein